LKSIQDFSLGGIGHLRFKAIDMNDVILLVLADAPALPITSVLLPPNQRADYVLIEAEFFLKFPPQPFFDCFARFESSARSDPKPLACLRFTDS